MLHYWCTKNDWRVCNIIYGHSVISGKTQLVGSSSLQLVAAAGAPCWWPAAVVEASGVRYMRRRSECRGRTMTGVDPTTWASLTALT